MKKLTCTLFLLTLLATGLSAQSESDFTRKGKWIIETGLGTLGLLGGASGITWLIPEEGGSAGVVAFQGGKFVTEDLAIMARFNLFDFGNVVGSFGVDGKYYLNGNIPIKLGGAATFGSGDEFIGNFSLGYAASLADNILLEPNVGVIYSDGAVFQVGIVFSLVL